MYYLVLLIFIAPYTCGVVVQVGRDQWHHSDSEIFTNLMEALELVENGTYTENVTISLLESIEILTKSFELKNLSGFSLISQSKTYIDCLQPEGLYFLDSTDIYVDKILFGKCGFNFTTIALPLVPWPAVFLFENVINITIVNVTFSESKGTALKLLDCAGNIQINNTLFSEAQVPITTRTDELIGGGSIYILQNKTSSNVIIFGCMLSSNRLIGEGYTRGGAIATIYHTAYNSLHIANLYLNGNHAMIGSCMYIAFIGDANHNRVLLYNDKVYGHKCYNSTSGINIKYKCVGSLNFQFLLNPQSLIAGYNNVTINNNEISKNVAFAGGAVSVSARRQSTEIALTNKFNMIKTLMQFNRAQVGSTIHLSDLPGQESGYLLMPLLQITITNSFITNKSNVTVGQGTLYSNKMSLQLGPSCVKFRDSMGTGIVMSGAQVTILNDTTVNFEGNIGKLGGGLALLNQASLVVQARSNVTFEGNSANDKGGAIYISNYFDNYALPMTGVQCAVKYDETSFFNFTGNIADHKENAIFATSVLSCADNELVNSSMAPPFCWSNWYYKNSTCSKQVFTSPATIQKTVPSLSIDVFPGFPFPLPIRLVDDYGKDITSKFVVSAFVIHGNASVDSSSQYIAGGNTTIYAVPGTVIDVAIETAEPRVVYTELKFNIQHCPPGYYSVSKESNIKGMDCICGKYPSNVVVCNKIISSAKIMTGWCMTYDTELGMGVVGPWQFFGHNKHQMEQDGYYKLPSTLKELDEFFCKPLKRTGRLCGQCEEGYGVPVYSYDNRCVACEEKEWPQHMILYLLAELVPLTVFFALVIVFNISITSGPAKAFVFYSQIITLPTLMYTIQEQINLLVNDNSALGSLLLNVYVLPYSIWNLDFFRSVLPPFCLTPSLSTIDVMALAYISALYSLLLIIVVYACIELHASNCRPVAYICMPLCHCLGRLRRNWKIQTSFIDAFATFLVLSYTKLCSVSFLVLLPNTVYSANGEVKGMKLLFMDASVEYGSSKHIWLMMISIIVLSLIVIPLPLILLLYPLQIVQRCLHRTHLDHRALRAFMDSFQGCYRIGTEKTRDARSFSCVYFILRIVVLAVMMSAMDSVVEGMLQVMTMIMVVCLLVTVQPYKKQWNNTLDVFIFCVLILVKVTILVQSVSHQLNNEFVALGIIMMLLPLVYISVYVGRRLFKKCYKKKSKISSENEDVDMFEVDFADRVINPREYEPLLNKTD